MSHNLHVSPFVKLFFSAIKWEIKHSRFTEVLRDLLRKNSNWIEKALHIDSSTLMWLTTGNVWLKCCLTPTQISGAINSLKFAISPSVRVGFVSTELNVKEEVSPSPTHAPWTHWSTLSRMSKRILSTQRFCMWNTQISVREARFFWISDKATKCPYSALLVFGMSRVKLFRLTKFYRLSFCW